MYSIKPVFNSKLSFDTGKVMYPLKTIYDENSAPSTDLHSRQLQLVASIEDQLSRIESILSQFKEKPVKQKVTEETTQTGTSVPSKLPNIQWPELSYPVDIVINADPNKMPGTPWTFKRLFGNQVLIRTHKHSTYTGSVDWEDNDNSNTNRTQGIKLIFTIIFRHVNDVEIMIDPLNQMLVRGEANLFRFLCRTFPIFPKLSAFDETLVDHFIDLIGLKILSDKTKDRQDALKSLGVHLSKREFLVGSEPSAADLFLHTVLKSTTGLSLPSSVLNFHKSMVAHF